MLQSSQRAQAVKESSTKLYVRLVLSATRTMFAVSKIVVILGVAVVVTTTVVVAVVVVVAVAAEVEVVVAVMAVAAAAAVIPNERGIRTV